MKYTIVEDETAAGLEVRVVAAIEDGYEPLGGVSVAVLHETWENDRKGYQESATEYTYAQAMIDRSPVPTEDSK